ncbi:MAG: hypothetical protein IT460_14290 [Planctomycetes bacterium]|nr:hypothetical protein [Planctomycetota bacterium]
MRRSTVTSLALACVVAGAAVLAARSDAGGGPARPPVPTPGVGKVDAPLLAAMVGSWDVTSTGPAGPSRARATFRAAAGGTALLHEYESSTQTAFAGVGVLRVSPDGRTVTAWWFDSYAPEPQKLSGPLTKDRAELYGSSNGGPLTIVWERVADGLDFTLRNGETTVLSERYRRP